MYENNLPDIIEGPIISKQKIGSISIKLDDEIIGYIKILKKTKTLVFLFCELKCNNITITSASGVWKILKTSPSNLGPGG